jgi:hypothetical protein
MKLPMKRRPLLSTAFAALTCLALAGCAEKPQTLTPKADAKPWDTPASGYAAPGFKPGDQAAWEEQMRKRAQGQNEYSRAVATP